MSKTAITEAQLGMPPAIICHTYLRLRGQQRADITVFHAATPTARVSLRWGGLLMSFVNAEAAQDVLEGLSAARATLAQLPAEVPAPAPEPYDRPSIVIDWTCRPKYAVMTRSALSPDERRTIRWTEVYLGPVTLQILDRAAFHSAVQVLALAHTTAVAEHLSALEVT